MIKITLGVGNNTYKVRYGDGVNEIVDFGASYFTATLSNSLVFPAVESSAIGKGTVALARNESFALVHLEAKGFATNVTGAHIDFVGGGTFDGFAKFHLHPPTATSFKVDDTWTLVTGLRTWLVSLKSEGLFFEIDTVANPNGEIRSRITDVPTDTGADVIDVSSLGIGSITTLHDIISDDSSGNARLKVVKNGVTTSLTLTALSERDLRDTDFKLSTSTASQSITGTQKIDYLFGGGGHDTIRGLKGNDRLYGEDGNDTLDGGAGNDTLDGGAGNDKVSGGVGKDTLKGGSGKDILIGGAGRDTMTGDSSADRFDFNSVSETGKTSLTRDIIRDFSTSGGDLIDLSTIDANGGGGPNGKFEFVKAEGAKFTGVKGQVIWEQQDFSQNAKDKTVISGDINGDGRADFQIELTGLKTLMAGDFIL